MESQHNSASAHARNAQILTASHTKSEMAQSDPKILSAMSKIQVTFLLVALTSCIPLAENSAIPPNFSTKFAKADLNATIEVVSESVSQLADGPYWDAANNLLYFVDATKGYLCRLNVLTKELEKVNMGDVVSIIFPLADDDDEPGTFLVSKRNQLLKFNWDTQVTEMVAQELAGKERFNDGKFDPRGRFFIGTFKDGLLGAPVTHGGSLYRLDGNSLTVVSTGYTVSNGMAWSNDENHTKLYFIDTTDRKIYLFDYDIETGTPSNPRVFVDCHQNEDFHYLEFPDGMAIDDTGFLWICMYAGGRLVKIDPETGRVVDQVALPTAGVPSALARGIYEGRDGFYVTTAANYLTPKPDDGKILHVSFTDSKLHTVLA